ncbi:MAG: hypothetical protein HY927_15315 [Elusimicrobia bacterium]|nr:hypothetical protein [Elusimicrobiota bacterium]
MKSLTIHGMDDAMAGRLAARAKEAGVSLNKLVKSLLAKALGLPSVRSERRKDFDAFCGVWTPKEAEVFRGAVRGFEKIDREDWA